jgi:hypothetical protein
MSTNEQPALYVVPTLEDQIRAMRRCYMECPMVDTLDDRIARQRRLVQKILEYHGITIDELLALPPKEIDNQDEELQLWYHVLRDCDYIDNLR